MLAELTVKESLDRVAGSNLVSGGDNVATLNGAVASALTIMVARLIIGKKGYGEHEGLMKHMSHLSTGQQELFVEYIDCDPEACDRVLSRFKLPKTTDEEKAARSAVIQGVTCFTILIPMQMARSTCELAEIMTDVTRLGNQNAITDARVAMMVARSTVLGALLNVCISLTSPKDTASADELKRETCRLEQLACMWEKELLEVVNQELDR